MIYRSTLSPVESLRISPLQETLLNLPSICYAIKKTQNQRSHHDFIFPHTKATAQSPMAGF